MKLEQKVAKVLDVNPRKEHHGENLALAVDVKLSVNCDAEILDQLEPTGKLREFLFGEHGPRFPELGAVAWGREYERSTLKVNKLELKDATVKKVSLEPGAGDSVKVNFTATLYPSQETVGKLANLIQEDVTVNLEQTQIDLVDKIKGDEKPTEGAVPAMH